MRIYVSLNGNRQLLIYVFSFVCLTIILKKKPQVLGCKIFLLHSLFADLNRLVSKPAYNKIILNILYKQSFIIKNYHLNRCTLEKKSPKVTISLNKPQPELKLRVDVQMYHDLGCLKAIKKNVFHSSNNK